MRFHWLLPSILSVFVLSSSAEAAKLRSWRFDTNQNRLHFKTDGGVQPKAKLIFNPTRLVIDLPGTTLQRSTDKQEYRGAVRSVRVGQFDENTTRIAIELSPGYKLDPNQVKVRGSSPSQWTVQLPTPQKIAASSLPNPRPLALPPSVRQNTSNSRKIFTVVTTDPQSNKNSSSRRTAINSTAIVQIHNIQVTADGLFVRTRGGGTPTINVSRSRDRSQIDFDLKGAALSPLAATNTKINRFGIGNIKLSQVQSSPPVVRMTMQVNQSAPDWQAAVSRFGGVTVLPVGGISAVRNSPVVVATTNSSAQPAPGLTTIESVEFNGDGSQLLIKTNQSLTYTSGWDRSSGLYRITLADTQLAREVKGPNLTTNSPLLRVRLQQPTPRTVLISVLPAAGVRVGELNQPSPELLALQLQRSTGALFPPSTPTQSEVISIPTTPPPNTPPRSTPPRRVGQKRIVVVIDPGHGGKDPGAIGLRGLQEKNVILPISKKIAAILEQQGIQVVMTRDSDYFVGLGPRPVIADRANATVFVSIHANSMPANRTDINGLETYYYDSGQRLARTIHNSILKSINVRDRGVRKARFYVLRKSSMPSVLVEVGFVTGVVDSPRLGTTAYQNQMAEAIARGILQYVQQNP
ncbi:N-acetylmuramoyl-L-alanine amidase [Synechocystis sp. PCC 7509]|uniref:N-acetylmuramoyl-L-alanine amidase n=1 Tax=Synechocystis sp. PCC 7509 TaxID=927677 RepID=UPI0002AC68AA|nr:N-acetylmuramoyl-L-alanine amidase [Synechocystis sp. PCC 7509]